MDIFIEPPYGPQGMAGGGFNQWVSRCGDGSRYNPYTQGPYEDPNAMYLRPQTPYFRGNRYGYGYEGGY
ncbi:hypothetical protein B0O99DRAFT_633406 [Bisporella sp. PMI_857]|nr:hypothetical protein B0O99DRAFT_633406 [Bisporella sp. PMI_857]